MKRNSVWIAVAAAVLSLFPASFGQDAQEHYSAVWQVTGGGAGGSTRNIDIRVNRYNTDAEIKAYAELLVEGGPDRLRSTLEKQDVGQVSPVGRVGVPLVVARKIVNGKKTIIRVLSLRWETFAELYYSGRSVDYPYTMLELQLDESGKGTGTAIGAAKITFNKKKGIYEIESFQHGTAYNRLVNVQRLK